MNQLLEAALKYASLGMKVLPCVPKQKVPMTAHGVHDASDSPWIIKKWWEMWPSANVAIACGSVSGLYVVDVDVDIEKGLDGRNSLKEFPDIPLTARQNTPRGGFHAFFRSSSYDPPKNNPKFRPGIEIKSDGTYVVVAPSVRPNSGVYEWLEGCAPGQVPLAEFPEFLRQESPPMGINVNSPGPARARREPASNDLLQRASLYLEKCDPAIQGQGGHSSLLWAATVLIHKFKLSDSQALTLLEREYNPRCNPPWDLSNPSDAKDFNRKIDEARKHIPNKLSEWELDDLPPSVSNEDTEWINELIKLDGFQPREKLQESSDIEFEELSPLSFINDGELEFLCNPPGLLGKMCKWINSTAIRLQPFLALGCSLAYCGALFGRKVRDEKNCRTNLYCMGVAPSSAGKAHAINCIRLLAEKTGTWPLLGGSDAASDSAIETRLSKEPSTLFMWDEVGHFLYQSKQSNNTYQSKIVPALMRLYSAAGNVYLGREYADDEKQKRIIQPCCCVYGTSEEGRFSEGLSPDELNDGWLSRCLVFRTSDMPNKNWDTIRADPPECLIKHIIAWNKVNPRPVDPSDITTMVNYNNGAIMEASPIPIIVPTHESAERIFRKFDNFSSKMSVADPGFSCLWSKAEENARKIALIVSCCMAPCDNISTSLAITFESAVYSCRLISYLLNDFTKIIVPNIVMCETDRKKLRLLKAIERNSVSGCTKTQLTKATQWLTRNERISALSDLIDAEEIVYETIQPSNGKGRPATKYYTTRAWMEKLCSQKKS